MTFFDTAAILTPSQTSSPPLRIARVFNTPLEEVFSYETKDDPV